MNRKMIYKYLAAVVSGIVVTGAGACGEEQQDEGKITSSVTEVTAKSTTQESTVKTNNKEKRKKSKKAKKNVVDTAQDTTTDTTTDAITDTTTDTTENVQMTESDSQKTGKYLVVIDAGHQQWGNSEQEPIGPGASATKAKVSGGTSGRTTGLPEYQLTLQVSLKLQNELEKRGYKVIMTRTSNDVDLSNSQRAMIANNNQADAFIRIHANGSDNTATNGAMTICQTSGNIYNGELYQKSKLLSTCVLDSLVASTGCQKQYVWETDSMSGINWAQVPVTIVEMGYMTNPAEDQKMATEGYQLKIADGIADGIEQYFKNNE